MLVAPAVLVITLLFTFFIWLYKEEKRREQQRQQRNEEWKRELRTFRDSAKSFSEHMANKKVVFIDLGEKSSKEKLEMIELVKEQLKNDTP